MTIIDFIHCIATCMETPHYLSPHCTASTVPIPKLTRCLARDQIVTCSISRGDTYFYFKMFAFFASLQVGGALANDIKHGHSPVVIVVLDPKYG